MADASTALPTEGHGRPPLQPSRSDLAVKLLRRFSLEVGPTLVFVGMYWLAGMLWATAAFMAAAALSTVLTYLRNRRLPVVPFIGVGLVLIFGGLTLVYDAPRFIQMRPTVINGCFAAALLIGLLLRRNLLQMAMQEDVSLRDHVWRRLTWRLVAFLVFMAALNEIVRLGFSVEVWVLFKAFGLLPLNLAFGLSQLPMLAAEARRADQPG